jgi:hypothetical protein
MPTQAPPALETVAVTFRFHSDHDEIHMRFPVFWGPQRFAEDVRMQDMGDYLEATVELPKSSLVRYQYAVPSFDYDHREQFRQHWEVNRYVFADADKTVTDEQYAFGPEAVERPAKVHGRVTGEDGEPVLQAVVVADGILTLTVDGYYEIEVRDRELPLTVFMLDGSYRTESRLVTPGQVDLVLTKAEPVTVRLNVDADPPEHHAVRLYGGASQMGARLLVGNVLSKDSFVTVDGPIEIQLHEGQWVDYQYSVGNPVISYEHDQGGAYVIRSFVAEDGLEIDDSVGSFVGGDRTVTLTVEVPEYTAEGDVIGVEGIHPTPLFMHKIDATTWVLTLSNYDTLGRHASYYKTIPGGGREAPIERTIGSTDEHHVVSGWWNQDGAIPTYTFDPPVFQNAFELFAYPADYYSSFHDQFLDEAIRRFAGLGYGGLTLTDAWGGYVRLEPTPYIVAQEPLPAYTPVDALTKWTALAHKLGLEVMVQPQLGGGESLLATGKEFDETWWRAWLVQIERFNMHMARAAQKAGVDYLMFRAKEPGFLMPQSFVPEYSAGLVAVIEKMRTVYDGRIVVGYEEFVEGVDYHNHGDLVFQVAYDIKLSTNDPTQEELDARVEELFDERYEAQYQATGKPMWIILGYQSVDGQVTGFFAPEADGPHTLRNHDYPLDLEEQRMIYEAFYKAAGRRDWIEGFALFGYGFTDTPLGRDVVPNGKPAEALSSAWAKAMPDE